MRSPKGFNTQNECIETIREIGMNPETFLYVRLNGMWFGVNARVYFSSLIIAKDRVYYRDVIDGAFSFKTATFKPYTKPGKIEVGNRIWDQNAAADLKTQYPDYIVLRACGLYEHSEIETNNIATMFTNTFAAIA